MTTDRDIVKPISGHSLSRFHTTEEPLNPAMSHQASAGFFLRIDNANAFCHVSDGITKSGAVQ